MRSSPLKHSGMDHTVFTLQTHHTCLHLVSVHQTAPPLTSNSSHLIAAYIWLQHLSTPRGWKAELADLQLTVYPYKWLPINCRSGSTILQPSPRTPAESKNCQCFVCLGDTEWRLMVWAIQFPHSNQWSSSSEKCTYEMWTFSISNVH